MFFALGFFVAGFIAVLLTSALNQRAERLANRRMRAMFPVSLEEVAAERDHMRAEFAVATRNMERKQTRLHEEKAAALGDAGKQLSFANALKRELDDARGKVSMLEATQADLKGDLDTTRKDLEIATRAQNDSKRELETLREEKGRSARGQAEAEKRIEGQRIAIAELEERVRAISAAASEQKKQADRRSDELVVEKNAVQTLQETVAGHRANASRLGDRIGALEKARDEARIAAGAIDKLEAEARSLRDRLAQSQDDNQTLRRELAAIQATHASSVNAANPEAGAARSATRMPAAATLQTATVQSGPDADNVERLQADLARIAAGAPLVEGEAAALRQRIVHVADAIMARPEVSPPPKRRNARAAQNATRKSAF